MGHGIEINDSMFSAREVPWHGLGVVVEDTLTATEALKVAGLDWQVELVPAFADTPKGMVNTNAYFPMTRIRSKEIQYEFVGNGTRVVSEKYELLQNRDAFTFMDNLVDQGLKYETAGSLRNRAWVWMTAKLPKQILVGGVDATDVYLLLSNSHDGTKAVRVDVTPVRVVCQNTLNMAWGSSKRSWSARHLATLEGRLAQARTTLELTFDYVEEWQEQAELLMMDPFTDRQMKNLLDKLIDETPRAQNHRDTILSLFAESPTIKGTPAEGNKYGALNAVGEYFDHIRFADADDRMTLQSRALGSWEGVGARTRNKAALLLLG